MILGEAPFVRQALERAETPRVKRQGGRRRRPSRPCPLHTPPSLLILAPHHNAVDFPLSVVRRDEAHAQLRPVHTPPRPQLLDNLIVQNIHCQRVGETCMFRPRCRVSVHAHPLLFCENTCPTPRTLKITSKRDRYRDRDRNRQLSLAVRYVAGAGYQQKPEQHSPCVQTKPSTTDR